MNYYNDGTGTIVAISYDHQINDEGEFVPALSSASDMDGVADGDVIGYDSSISIGRFCVPSTKVLSEAFSDYLDSFTGALSKG